MPLKGFLFGTSEAQHLERNSRTVAVADFSISDPSLWLQNEVIEFYSLL